MTQPSVFGGILNMLVECLGVCFFFRVLENRTDGKVWRLAPLSLLILVPLYIPVFSFLVSPRLFSTADIINQILRSLINWLAIYGYLRLKKELTRAVCAYLAAFYLLMYMVSFNLRMALFPLLSGSQLAASEYAMTAMLAVIQWSIVVVASYLLKIRDITEISSTRWGIIIISILVELYLKWSLSSPEVAEIHRPVDLIFYSLSATVGIFALIVLFERNVRANNERAELQLEQLQMQYEMQNAKRALRANTDIRRLYHDMKNHLLALQSMMDGGKESREYLAELCSQLEEYEVNVYTGNSVADALLAEKMERARLDGIRFNVCLDLTGWSFVRTVDLVTILGNATDNAVEALQMLPEGQERIVYLKSARYANMEVLRISNQYAGKLTEQNGVLRTGKADPQMHGIGLSNIQKAVRRYGGNVETQFENEGNWFRLVIMLPLPETKE